MPAHIRIDESFCKGCALCVEVCPHRLIALGRQPNAAGIFPATTGTAMLSSCTGCSQCAQICPDVAISIFRESD